MRTNKYMGGLDKHRYSRLISLIKNTEMLDKNHAHMDYI